MAFVVEDGTGLSNSNAYVSVAEADAYFLESTNRWIGTDLSKQKALVRATRAIDLLGAGKFRGVKLLSTQALAWPRDEAYDGDGFKLTGIPNYLKYAVFEAALAELEDEGTLMPDTERTPNFERVEGVVQVAYADGTYPGITYRAVMNWLSFVCTGSGMKVVRA